MNGCVALLTARSRALRPRPLAYHLLGLLGQDVQLRAQFESADRADEDFERYRRRLRVAPQYLRTHGHANVASLLESNLEEFQRRAQAGTDDLWGTRADDGAADEEE